MVLQALHSRPLYLFLNNGLRFRPACTELAHSFTYTHSPKVLLRAEPNSHVINTPDIFDIGSKYEVGPYRQTGYLSVLSMVGRRA